MTLLLERTNQSTTDRNTDFNERHPGEKLGSILQKVSDLMHMGNVLASEAIKIMHDKKLLIYFL